MWGAPSSSSTCWPFQSLCAFLAPHCIRFTFPIRAPSPPRPVVCHLARSLSWRIIITTFLITRQGGGCKFHVILRGICKSNMFSFNDVLRHEERRRVFNVDGLRRLAAESVDRSADMDSPRVGLTVPSSSLCVMASKWWRVSRIQLRFPST